MTLDGMNNRQVILAAYYRKDDQLPEAETLGTANELPRFKLRGMRAIVANVPPAQAGVQKKWPHLDSRLRGNDKAAASCGE
jgi:hypothetical protein